MQLKILHLVPQLTMGGVETSTLALAKAQKDLGNDPQIVAGPGCLQMPAEQHNIPWINLSFATKDPINLLKVIRSLRQIVVGSGCDIVHVHSRLPAWCMYIALRGLNVPWVTTFHGAYSCQNFLKKRYNEAMLWGKGVLAPSQYIKSHIERQYGILSNIEVIYPGIDMEHFNPKHFTAAMIQSQRLAWGVLPNDKVIYLPGRLSSIKGHSVAIEALRLLNNLQYKLVIQGNGKDTYLQKLQALAIDLQSQVIFVPAEPDLRLAYLASDVVVNVSTKPESFGLTMLEASAMGRQIIVNDLGGTKEIVQSLGGGQIIQPNNPHALMQALRSIDQQSCNINQVNLQQFAQRAFAQQTVQFYHNYLKR